ncbi:MAG: metallophosphoesterase [Ardenticatenaceae bacterium]|nr:metallophosphoesterase [Ardenticatenaceae bacterium]MCB8949506.1 metallophosphoesterase [Ardenticatenaceae bacterium]
MSNLNTQWDRVVDLTEGQAMVVTDLHGDWDAYERYRDTFFQLRSLGQADILIFNGDMIHASAPAEQDKSLEIVLDVMRLKEELGDSLICVLGNHELPHIYSITLQKGDDLFTPRFEFAMGSHRQNIVSFFDSLPFYVRTPGGVSICHAGGSTALGETNGVERLFNFSHQKVLQRTRAQITKEERPELIRAMRRMHGRTYNEMARKWFAVSGLTDPRYDDFLVGTLATSDEDFELLWSALFSRNEKEYGNSSYQVLLTTLLQTLSNGYNRQTALITGHIDVRGGYKLVNQQQLRMASAKHASPREAGLYLLFNIQEVFASAEALVPNLRSVFRN